MAGSSMVVSSGDSGGAALSALLAGGSE
ncbi:hypothetical protein STAN_7061 [Streptomyces sp. CBMAI 2042]|nr:hypothetical protein STAN_7061 [Streptomyces sp. CBMAI 2042]